MSQTQSRADALRQFVEKTLAVSNPAIAPASADASFRSYWRVSVPGRTYVVMDAPADKENVAPWLDVDARLHGAGLHAPAVHAVDREQGFILMEDLGSRTYLPELNGATVDVLYSDALDALLRMQTQIDPAGLPLFDEAFITMELERMPEWFLVRHLGHAIECDEWDVIELAFRRLITSAREQPQAFMHRDYHSRNLLISGRVPDDPQIALPSPGIVDFQDALIGPITYDLASLLRDCYISWDAERVEGWAESYRERLRHAHLIDTHVDAARFRRWFDLIGLQRHLKVLGNFTRLWYRDGKPQYLADLPLTWHYVISIAQRYEEFAPLADLLLRALGERDITQPRDAATAA